MDRFKLYRSESVSGTKDWAILAQSDQVQIRYGKTGSKLRLTEIPLSQCESNSPQLEMKKRIANKLGDSSSDYAFVDEVIIDTDGKLREFSNPKLKQLIYWDLKFNPNESGDVVQAFKLSATDLKSSFPNIDVHVSGDFVRVNGYQLSFNPQGGNSIDLQQGIGTGFFGIESGVFVALWFFYASNKLESKLSMSSDDQSEKAGSYLESLGFFLEDDVTRFSEFASKFNFLSPVEKIFSRLNQSTPNLDWL